MARRMIVVLWALLLPSLLLAQHYTTVDVPNSSSTDARGISANSNNLAGTFGAPGGSLGFLYRHGSFQIVEHPAVLNTLPFTNVSDINNRGIAVGYWADFVVSVLPPVHGFFYFKGNFTPIDFPDTKIDTYPMSVNNLGQVVGDIQDSKCDGPAGVCHRRGFLLSNGQYSTLEFPGAVATFPRGINNHGVIVGAYQNVDGPAKGFLFVRGHYKSLACPGSEFGNFQAINDSGDIVANCGTTGTTGVLFTKHKTHTIAFPGATATRVNDVGNRFHGKVPVVGNYSDTNNVLHGFYALIPLGGKEDDQ